MQVEAYVASWIEIVQPIALNNGHSVEAYVASWIEIAVYIIYKQRQWSRLT